MPVIIDRNMDAEFIGAIRSVFPKRTIIKSYYLSGINGALSTHPDIQIHFLNGKTAVCAPECFNYYKKNLSRFGIDVVMGETSPENTYPADIAYNVARVGIYVISKMQNTEPKILEYYQSHKKYRLINTKQGYAKCNLCIAGSNAVITEDENLFGILSELGDIKVLKTEKGRVSLRGYEYGFIGGASGLIDDIAVFCGKLPRSIIDFLDVNNIKYCCLAQSGLVDYGSIIAARN